MTPQLESIETEQSVLGGLLMHPATMDAIEPILRLSDFVEPLHRQMYEALQIQHRLGAKLTPALLLSSMGVGHAQEVQAGSVTHGEYLARLAMAAPAAGSLRDHVRILRNLGDVRGMRDMATEVLAQTQIAGPLYDPKPLIEELITGLDSMKVSEAGPHSKRMSAGQAAMAAIMSAQDALAGRRRAGCPYGIPTLDKVTLGIQPGQLVVAAGRPGMGKSAFAAHVALASAQAGYGVHYTSLEMTGEQLGARFVAAMAYDPRQPIPYFEITRGTGLDDDQLERLFLAQRYLDALPLLIEQQSGLSLSQIGIRAKRAAQHFENKGFHMGLLVVDHLGLVASSDRYKGSKVNEISEITAALKVMAKDQGIGILLLSQLNRAVENRENKRPTLADLRDSGSIEQDADAVLGLYREAYYLEKAPDQTPEVLAALDACRHTLCVDVLKQRQGATPQLEVYCDIACNIIAERHL
jgi:replicative DNA helicase